MRKSLIATLVASAFTSLASLPAGAENLLQIYQAALGNDPTYASARASMTAGQEKIAQGRSGLLPSAALSGGYSKTNMDVVNPPLGTRDFFSNQYTLSLTQPLFRWGNWEQYEQGKLSVAISEAQFAQAQQDLILRVSQAYFDVLTAQDVLASVQAQQTAITEQLASAKRNFQVGTATITDTHEAQARFDLAAAQALAAESDLQIKRAALQQIVGTSPKESLYTLRPGVQLSSPTPNKMEEWVDSAERQNYGVVSQQLSVEVAKRDIKKNRAGHAPTLDLVASRNHTTQSGNALIPTAGASTTNASTIGIQWNIPIFSGFAVTSKVRESIALEDKARNDYESAKRNAAQGARQSYLGVNSGLAQVKALEAAEASSQLALESNKLGYQVGVRINIDVLNAQQQLFATRKDLSKARYDTLMNGLRLKSAAGTLKEEDIVQINDLLQAPSLNAPPPNANAANATGSAEPAIPSQVPQTQPAVTVIGNAAERDAVMGVVNQWAQAWSARDAERYLDFYSADFKLPDGLSRQTWTDQRRNRVNRKDAIDVKLESPQVTLDGGLATVSFRQLYRSGRLNDDSLKTLVLVKQDGNWKIQQERAGY
jgi:outer membrane protein